MIDAIDRQILELLQQDGRMANKAISHHVGLVQSATCERLRKLRERGVIKSYEVRIDPEKVSCPLVAFVFVRTNEIPGDWDAGEAFSQIPEVQEVYNIAGEDCYLLKIRTKNTLTLSRLLRKRIGGLESVTSTKTTIVMESYKETTNLTLEYAETSGNGKK